MKCNGGEGSKLKREKIGVRLSRCELKMGGVKKEEERRERGVDREEGGE